MSESRKKQLRLAILRYKKHRFRELVEKLAWISVDVLLLRLPQSLSYAQAVNTAKRVAVAVGSPVIAGPVAEHAGPRRYLSVVAFTGHGDPFFKQRMILRIEGYDSYASLNPCILEKGVVGVLVGRDVESSELAQALVAIGADLLVLFPVELSEVGAIEAIALARSVESMVPVVVPGEADKPAILATPEKKGTALYNEDLVLLDIRAAVSDDDRRRMAENIKRIVKTIRRLGL